MLSVSVNSSLSEDNLFANSWNVKSSMPVLSLFTVIIVDPSTHEIDWPRIESADVAAAIILHPLSN